MKRLLISMGILVLVFVCKESFAQVKDDKAKVKDNMSYPYAANYSSDFTIGNPAHSKMILELWKDWDDNAFDRHNYMADTVVMYFPDGSFVRGKDSCLAGAKRFRGSMTSATSSLLAWVPLKSVDRNEEWVMVWGTETDTFRDGKTTTRDLHEAWRINKDGKVDFMKQFTSEPAKEK